MQPYAYSFEVADKTFSNCAFKSAVQVQAKVSTQDSVRWDHVAGVVNGNKLYLYVNGQEVAYTYDPYRTVVQFCDSSASLQIGAYLGNQSASWRFDGELDEIRISNTARYTSSFTPQKTPFINDNNTISLYHFDGNVN